jgi:DNA (cytosine-5)-methyltransferase 1
MRNEKPTHLDLFSGIGGFALAAGWAGFETVGFCDNEPYAQAVLKKHWPDVPIHGDIKALDGSAYRGITLLTGGFPCQPFSNAGKRRGKDDDRYLWPQMLRVIQEARPAWIVGENVVGIIGLALDQVCSELEAFGYEVEPIIIPACSINAPHRRDRVWIIANTKGIDDNRQRRSKFSEESRQIFHRGNISHNGWEEKWTKTATSLCRVANGIPHRVDRLKGLGNAIVPQVAYQIIKGIAKLVKEKR